MKIADPCDHFNPAQFLLLRNSSVANVKILLWDIDGTLIRSGNAGQRAMNAAALAVFRIPGAFNEFDFAGRTDPWIVDTLCREHGHCATPDEVGRFYAVYVDSLRRELHNPLARTCAGVRELLAHFAAQPAVVQGLLTGNIAAGARAKLEHFDLWRYFVFGAFADDSGDRNQLGPVAHERARAHLGRDDLRPSDFVVIGDTPHDIACARAFGAHCAVAATGRFTVADLAAHGPDLVVRDFGDPTVLTGFVERLG